MLDTRRLMVICLGCDGIVPCRPASPRPKGVVVKCRERFQAIVVAWAVGLLVSTGWAEPPGGVAESYSIPLTVTSRLPAKNVPLDPLVDFDKALSAINAAGVLDPNSSEVRESKTGRVVHHSLGDGFGIADRGRVQWVAAQPDQRAYEIRFRTASVRPVLRPRRFTPLVGVGDLVSYNAGVPRPVA
ncbi:MAG: hypothetical protein VB859_17360, partial [Planctomycetaceae bacterium]